MDKVQTILIVDPETDFLEWAQHELETPNTRVVTAVNSEQGYRMYATETPDLLICDTHLQPFSGLELLVKVRQRDSNAMVILTSAGFLNCMAPSSVSMVPKVFIDCVKSAEKL